MSSIIFLPGILGSKLYLGEEEIWPPTAWEATGGGYDRMEKLSDPNAFAGQPIESVLCFKFYEQIISDLQDIASGNASAPPSSFHSFGYDWRIDLRDIAEIIVRRIDDLPDGDKNEISFVAHSMGCLVVRLILESKLYENKPWFNNIKSFIALAGPHLGSPTALVRAMGLEGVTSLSPSDVKNFAANPDFPSIYQLFPAPGIVTAWDTRSGAMDKLDIYDHNTATRLGLNLGNLKKAKEVHQTLANNQRPAHVDYVYLAGSGNDTWSRVDIIGAQKFPRKGKDTGDGTVPLWSSVNPTQLNHAAPATHDKVFRNDQIRNLLYRSLGATPPVSAFSNRAGKPFVSLFAVHTIYATNTPIELMIIPLKPTTDISGQLNIEYSNCSPPTAFVPKDTININYKGPKVEHIKIRINDLTEIGFYKISFNGSHATADNGEAMFGISNTDGGVRD